MLAIRNFFRNEKILFLEFYENFDVLTFNETNLYEDKLPNVKSDLILENFYEPKLKDPF